MAKKSFFEKLGLVEGVAASEYDMPDTTNELRVCSGVGDHYINGDFPEDEPVQVEVPEGDTIDVRAVYETNGMNPADAVTVYKIKDVIDTFPSEMPTKTKRATVKNLMATLGYDATAIISDAKQRKELLRAVGNDKMNALFDEMKSNDQVADVYSNLDRLRASTGTDKMLNATRDGLQESREKAAGAKVLYQTSREGKLDKADANTADYKVSSYLDSLKKSNPNVTTYSIPDLNALTKSSGLNTQSKK